MSCTNGICSAIDGSDFCAAVGNPCGQVSKIVLLKFFSKNLPSILYYWHVLLVNHTFYFTKDVLELENNLLFWTVIKHSLNKVVYTIQVTTPPPTTTTVAPVGPGT